MKKFIKKFKELSLADSPLVGEKNASLAELFNELASEGVGVPDGLAIIFEGHKIFLKENHLEEKVKDLLVELDRENYANLQQIGAKARELILSGKVPEQVSREVILAYNELGGGKDIAVAVRSSTAAGELPEHHFVGLHESYLNISGEKNLLEAVKHCYASFYTDRAIAFREEQGLRHEDLALSVGIQKMVRADLGCSGLGFSLEPGSGFREMIHISGVWGLEESMLQGLVIPDEFDVFKPGLERPWKPVILKRIGRKEVTMVYAGSGEHSSTVNIETPPERQDNFVLDDREVLLLARWILLIEAHYGKPMRVEWAKDGINSQLFITQAYPEKLHAGRESHYFLEYRLKGKGRLLAGGVGAGSSIAAGKVRHVRDPKELANFRKGEILVTHSTNPDWDPLLRRAGAVITTRGGRTSHAAIVARELGVPAVVGVEKAMELLQEGQQVTVSCRGRTGKVYEGKLDFEKKKIDLSKIQLPETKVKFILSDPERAYELSFYPNHGVGLLRMEFMITHQIKVHPMALVKFDQLKDPATRKTIEELCWQYPDKRDYFVEELARGLAMMAAAFYPKEVMVRMSDFKSSEYARLLGGKEFEPEEENPMLGFRGAARYIHPRYREGFELECRAVLKVREEMGLDNLKLMIPFCRTLEEARRVINQLKIFGLSRGEKGLGIHMMMEIPSNVVLASEFSELFDGFSIGSNDLTQLCLGIDRESPLMASQFNENDAAVRRMIAMAMEKAGKAGVPMGFCGQAPSDFPEFASFLVQGGIDSISFNPDALLSGIEQIQKTEEKPENS